MKCPVCKIPLIVVERHGIEIDYCHKCHGFWFDEGEIKLLSETHNLTLHLPDLEHMTLKLTTEKERRCPRCNKFMNKMCLDEDTQIIIDRCPHNDGLWFDTGELSQTMQKYATTKSGPDNQLVNFLGELFSVK